MLAEIGLVATVTPADSAIRAIEMLGELAARFDLAFVDVRMPLMDGFDLLRWIRRHTRWCALDVVMLTSSDDARDMERARILGANGYLLKSYVPAKFAAVLAGIVPHLAGHLLDPAAGR